MARIPSFVLLATAAFGSSCVPASAQTLTPAAADRLRPGQFVWADRGYAEAPVSVVVNLATQRAYAYRDDALIGVASVSTGTPGHRTPAGDFSVLQKRVFHRSNLYSNAPMPYMQRLTWDGIALHAGHNPGRPASHGCIRLPRGFAMALYAVTSVGAPVTIVDAPGATPPRERAPIPYLIATLTVERGAALVTWRARSPRRAGGDDWLVPYAPLRAPS